MRSRGERLGARPWLRLRRQVIERAGYRCERCGRIAPPYEVHHVNDRTDNRLEALVCWCKRCHVDHHRPEPVAGSGEWQELVAELF